MQTPGESRKEFEERTLLPKTFGYSKESDLLAICACRDTNFSGEKTDKFGRHSEKVLREVPLGGILPVQAEASLYSHIGFFTDP